MRLPRSDSKLVTAWLWTVALASIIAIVSGDHVAEWAALAPSKILHGQLWRLVTWPLVETWPTSLLVTLLAIYRCGGDLADRWGDRRLKKVAIGLVVFAGVATTLAALVTGTDVWRCGGVATLDALIILWARQFPTQPVNLFYGMVSVSGRQLIAIVVGLNVLLALNVGLVWFLPELAMSAGAALMPKL